MLSAMSAEALKLRRHRATWLLVWIFPILVLVGYSIAIIAQLVQNNPPAAAAPALPSGSTMPRTSGTPPRAGWCGCWWAPSWRWCLPANMAGTPGS
jgi:hypothetical protein